MLRAPRDDDRYSWTRHVVDKMRHYGIGEGRVKRVIRAPKRTEEGIVPGTVAVMQPAGTKRYQEIWVMYKLVGAGQRANAKFQLPRLRRSFGGQAISKPARMKIITAWRYPGKSPERNPIPQEILKEVKRIL